MIFCFRPQISVEPLQSPPATPDSLTCSSPGSPDGPVSPAGIAVTETQTTNGQSPFNKSNLPRSLLIDRDGISSQNGPISGRANTVQRTPTPQTDTFADVTRSNLNLIKCISLPRVPCFTSQLLSPKSPDYSEFQDSPDIKEEIPAEHGYSGNISTSDPKVPKLRLLHSKVDLARSEPGLLTLNTPLSNAPTHYGLDTSKPKSIATDQDKLIKSEHEPKILDSSFSQRSPSYSPDHIPTPHHNQQQQSPPLSPLVLDESDEYTGNFYINV